ncbi:MAG TPA: CoA-binding protein, partial [Paludibacter sp.]|nr:CoA-binding protein [Paludibacter sp.]
IPETELNLLVLTAPQHTSGIIEQAIVKGIKNIWIQQESETPAAIKLCEAASLKPIYNHCIFMFSKPTGIHHFHYGLKKFFGSMPK